MIIPGTSVSVYMNLDDIGLFRKRRSHEVMSQRERAEQIRDAFGDCMRNTIGKSICIMPSLCGLGNPSLSCAHLLVDYANFTGSGIPLTGKARAQIDGRLRAIGTLVYRTEAALSKTEALAGDIHLPALGKTTFPAGVRRGAMKKAQPKPAGFLARLFG